MDSRAKVQAGKIAVRADDRNEAGDDVRSATVDFQIVELLKALDSAEQGRSIIETRKECLNSISHDLRKAQLCIARCDNSGLDTLAQELTHNALKLGAGKILSGAIEIQGLARIGDFQTASELLGSLEVELVNVREQLI